MQRFDGKTLNRETSCLDERILDRSAAGPLAIEHPHPISTQFPAMHELIHDSKEEINYRIIRTHT